MALEVGHQAPDGSVWMADGETVHEARLRDFLGEGEIVLAFFPLAFTSVCTDEMCAFRDELPSFQDLDARVYGASVDSPFALNAFIRQQNLTFPLLSDFNRDLIRGFGVVHDALKGLHEVAMRSVFVLDEDGIVRYRWVSEDPGQSPDPGDIRAAVASRKA